MISLPKTGTFEKYYTIPKSQDVREAVRNFSPDSFSGGICLYWNVFTGEVRIAKKPIGSSDMTNTERVSVLRIPLGQRLSSENSDAENAEIVENLIEDKISSLHLRLIESEPDDRRVEVYLRNVENFMNYSGRRFFQFDDINPVQIWADHVPESKLDRFLKRVGKTA